MFNLIDDQTVTRGMRNYQRYRYVVTRILPFLLAKEGLSADEIEFAIEKGLGEFVSLQRMRLLFPSDSKVGRKPKDIPLNILKEIKRLREEGHGYRKISKLIYRNYGFYISGMTVRKLFLEDIDGLIKELEDHERELNRIETAIERGDADKLTLKDLVRIARERGNEKAVVELENRLKKLLRKAENLTIYDVL